MAVNYQVMNKKKKIQTRKNKRVLNVYWGYIYIYMNRTFTIDGRIADFTFQWFYV